MSGKGRGVEEQRGEEKRGVKRRKEETREGMRGEKECRVIRRGGFG